MSTEFIYDDGGRALAGYKGSAGDCVCRALAIATQLPCADIYKILAENNAKQRVGKGDKKGTKSARNGINVKRTWFKKYMHDLGFRWVSTMGIGTGCKVHLRAEELPPGRLVVVVSKHYTTMIDGVIHDTHDPKRGSTGYYKEGELVRQIPESRCVYGYWVLERVED